jgi:hypothetical protein
MEFPEEIGPLVWQYYFQIITLTNLNEQNLLW